MEWPSGNIELNDDGLDDFVKRYPAAIVDLWGPSCAPCKMIAPVLDQLASEMKGKVAFGKLDVTKNLKTPMKLGVRSIPTLLFYKQGRLVKSKTGFLPKPTLISELREIL